MFEFAGEQHVAIVTICEEKPDQTNYTVRLMNREPYHLIPEGIINFISKDNTMPYATQNRLAAELFLALKAAIKNYLSQSSSVSK